MAAMLGWSQCSAVEPVLRTVGGAWVFKGTRVPVRALVDPPQGEARVNDFLNRFAGVTEEQVVAVLERAEQSLVETWARPRRKTTRVANAPQLSIPVP